MMELSAPVLLVTLLGFDKDQEQIIDQQLARCTATQATWSKACHLDADAWLINGECAHVLDSEHIEVREGNATLRFNRIDTQKAIAFCEPLHGFEPSCRFRLDRKDSIGIALIKLAAWLSPKLAQHALAEFLVRHGSNFTRRTVLEVHEASGKLLAVVDFGGHTAVSPTASPAALSRAHWTLRLPDSAPAPARFRGIQTELLLWRYARRGERGDLLPQRYREGPIYLRRVPAVSIRELSDQHLWLLRELSFTPRTFRKLKESAGWSDLDLSRALAALYVVGAITSKPSRSRGARELERAAQSSSWLSTSGLDTARSSTGFQDLTAPGLLPLHVQHP